MRTAGNPCCERLAEAGRVFVEQLEAAGKRAYQNGPCTTSSW